MKQKNIPRQQNIGVPHTMAAMPIALIGAAIFGLMLFFAPVAPAHANVHPAGCSASNFVLNLGQNPTAGYDTVPPGATNITYTVSTGNPQDASSTGCDVTGVTVTLMTPDGVNHTLQTGGSYPIGTPVAVLGTVPYLASSTNEVGGKLSASATSTGDLHDTQVGTDPVTVAKTVSFTPLHPQTNVTIAVSPTSTSSGGTVDVTVTEHNGGDVGIASTTVTLTPPGTVLSRTSPTFTGGDATNTGILDPGETWTWVVSSTVSSTTVYSAVGDGFDPLGAHITPPTYPDEQASTTVSIADAKISITPDGTNEINHTHTFIAHVDVNDGSGFVNAPDGTVITFGLTGVGTLSDPTCTTASSTGSCTVDDISSVPGVDTVDASTSVLVGGTMLVRATDGTGGSSDPATKTWVDANIQISPATSTDPIGDNHVLTGHVNVNAGTGGYVNAPDGTVIGFAIASGPGSLSGPTCTTASSTGSCTVTLTSSATGTTVINASTSVLVGGVTLLRMTNATSGNSGPANKTWTATGISTLLSSSTINASTSVSDSATLTGQTQNAGGTVTYTVYTNNVCTATSTSAGTVTVTGGIVPDSNSVTFNTPGTYYWQASYSGDGNNAPAVSPCQSEVLVVNENVPPLVTRTLGFWQTHTAFTESVFANMLGSSMPIGAVPHPSSGAITTNGQLFGAFYASIPKKTDGSKRTPLDQARMQLLQQLVAAKLNCAAFGCSTAIANEITAADTAYAGTSASAILNSASQLDAYNQSGDGGTIPSSLGSPGNATPKDSKSIANLGFWDAP